MMGGITEAVLLVAMGLGYVVCHLANREQKLLRTIGLFIGTFIIALSAMLILENIIFTARFCRKMRNMPQHQGMMMKAPGMTQAQPVVPVPTKPTTKK